MKQTYVLLLFFLSSVFCPAQTPAYAWSDSIQGNNDLWPLEGHGMDVDNFGNQYMIGSFMGSRDFDPGPGTFVLNAGSVYATFIVKYNSSGQLVWAGKIGGTQDCYGSTVALDKTGNLYITGRFSGTCDLDPLSGTHLLTASGTMDAFVLKLDNSGTFQWVKTLDGGGSDGIYPADITLDESQNIYLNGCFNGSRDFDPGPGVHTLSCSGSNVDMFVEALDNLGNFVWVKQITGITSFTATPMCIALDADNNVYSSGSFTGSGDFDPGAGTNIHSAMSSGDANSFVLKLDNAGNFLWNDVLGHNGSIYFIKVSHSGTVMIAGNFTGTADLDPGAGTAMYTLGPQSHGFVEQLSPGGNYGWSKVFQGGFSIIYGMALDLADNVYTAGQFNGMTDFDPGAGVKNFPADSLRITTFFSRLDNAGNYVWAGDLHAYSSSDNSTASCIGLDATGNIYCYGSFMGTLDFDPGSGVVDMSSSPYEGLYTLKLENHTTTGITSTEAESAISIYPNPASDHITIAGLVKPAVVTVYDVTGRVIFSQKSGDDVLQVDVREMAGGIYFVNVLMDGKSVTGKIVKE